MDLFMIHSVSTTVLLDVLERGCRSALLVDAQSTVQYVYLDLPYSDSISNLENT